MKIPNQNRLRWFILVAITMIVVFVALNFVLAYNVRNHYISLKEKEGTAIGEAYANSFGKTIYANKISEKLLDDHLLVALNVIKGAVRNHEDEVLEPGWLTNMATSLNLEEIYLYNEDLEIIASASGKYMGWVSPEDHPVHFFANGHLSFHIEDFRKDSDSDKVYKYGYIRLANRRIIQIGKDVDAINELTKLVDYKDSVQEIISNENIETVYFINTAGEFVVPDQVSPVEDLRPGFIRELRNHPVTSLVVTIGKEKFVDIFVPLNFHHPEVHTIMVTRYSLSGTNQLIWSTFLTISIPLSIMYAILTHFFISRLLVNQRVLDLAFLDPLTGLHNRTFLKERIIDKALNDPKDKGMLIFMDVKNFSHINRTYGFQVGDLIFSQIGERLKALKGFDNISRFSANQFIFYLKNTLPDSEIKKLLASINEAFELPFKINDSNLKLDVYMTVMRNAYYETFDALLNDSTYGLSLAKDMVSDNYVIFDDKIDAQIDRKNMILSLLKQAIEEEDFNKLYCMFQPIVSLKNQDVVAFEALIRLVDDDKLHIYPDEFISLAEENHLIIPLGKHVVKFACIFINLMKDHGYHNIRVSINVSAIEMLQADYVSSLLKTLASYEVEPSLITLEITESILLSEFNLINEKLQQLQAYGIRIALDDFGIGYSSFERLHNLNINVLKIDKQFVDRIKHHHFETVVVADIISMAHKFKLAVVGEGVDDETQKKYLEDHGCDMIQGYLFSKPLTISDAFILLRNWYIIKENKQE